MAAAVLGIERSVGDRLSPLATLALLVSVGAVLYAGLSLLVNRAQLIDLRDARHDAT